MKTNREETDPRFVVCIDDSTFWKKPYPKERDICEVEYTTIHPTTGKPFYKLKGYDYDCGVGPGKKVHFACHCFRPIENSYGEWCEVYIEQAELETAMGV